MKRRSFINQAGLGGMLLVLPMVNDLYADAKATMAVKGPGTKELPWHTEVPLKQAATFEFIKKKLNANNPQPDVASYPVGPSLQLLNPGIRSTIWGPAENITISKRLKLKIHLRP